MRYLLDTNACIALQVPDFVDAFGCEDAIMHEAREWLVDAGRRERIDLAGTVMACAAVEAPGVVRELAA